MAAIEGFRTPSKAVDALLNCIQQTGGSDVYYLDALGDLAASYREQAEPTMTLCRQLLAVDRFDFAPG
jgi:hypothetical protein